MYCLTILRYAVWQCDWLPPSTVQKRMEKLFRRKHEMGKQYISDMLGFRMVAIRYPKVRLYVYPGTGAADGRKYRRVVGDMAGYRLPDRHYSVVKKRYVMFENDETAFNYDAGRYVFCGDDWKDFIQNYLQHPVLLDFEGPLAKLVFWSENDMLLFKMAFPHQVE